MGTISLKIPDNLTMNTVEMSMLLATQLYEKGTLSLGQAADMANLSKRTFAELLAHYNVSIFNYQPLDLMDEMKYE